MVNFEKPEDFLVVPLKDGGVRVRLDRTTHGRVMCCLCFDWCTRDQLNPTDDGRVEDICKPCAEKEKLPVYKVMLGREVLEYIENWPEKNCEEFFEFLEHIAGDPIARTYDGGGSNSVDIHYRVTPYNLLYTVMLTVSDENDKKIVFVTRVEPRTRFSRFV